MGFDGIAAQYMNSATWHADALGIGFNVLEKQHLFWIAIRTRIDIFRKPRMGESFTLETWTEPPTHLAFDRDYTIRSGDEILSIGKTQWGLYNMELGKLEWGKNVYPEGLVPIAESNFSERFYRFNDEPTEFLGNYIVRSTDIDLGGHMNNVKYITAVEGMFSVAEWERNAFRSIEIMYKKACFEGETIEFAKGETEVGMVVRGNVNGETAIWMLFRR